MQLGPNTNISRLYSNSVQTSPVNRFITRAFFCVTINRSAQPAIKQHPPALSRCCHTAVMVFVTSRAPTACPGRGRPRPPTGLTLRQTIVTDVLLALGRPTCFQPASERYTATATAEPSLPRAYDDVYG